MEPLLSCLMITQPGREALARQAIDCWQRQTYRHRELVIVHDGPAPWDRTLRQEAPEARVIMVPPGATLGALRNLSIEAAAGEVLCQWDDDDQYAPERLAVQFQWMRDQGADACFLASQLHYFAERRELFVRDTGRRGIEGTVMHRRGLVVRYPQQKRSEDTIYMQQLNRRYRTTVLPAMPWLYLRTFHGHNTWDEAHHRRMMRAALDRRALKTLRGQLQSALDHYQIPRPVTVCGSDGAAFLL